MRVEGFDRCLAHLEDDQLNQFVRGLRPGSDIDARGVRFTDTLVTNRIDAVLRGGGFRTFGTAHFERARFAVPVYLNAWIFDRAYFDRAEFDEAVWFHNVAVRKGVSFVGARFAGSASFLVDSGTPLNLAEARFAGPVQIWTDANITCDSTRFENEVDGRLGDVDVVARRTTFGAASSIAGSIPGKPPRLLSLEATDVSNLELVDVDLRQCLFVGAHRLDQLRIAGRCEFNAPPASWRGTGRQTIADEHVWRGWPTESDVFRPVGPEQVASLYRSLRKALEDSKNEAGAGDFYYGEMDARRHSRETRRTERGILWCYWLLSGYGQRAGRALIALLVLIATVAVLLTVWGQPAENAARIAVGAVVFRDDRTELTTAGEWTVLVARFLGPVLLALAVLAVRARVKR